MFLTHNFRDFLLLGRKSSLARISSSRALWRHSTRPSSSVSSGPRVAVIGSGPSGLYVCARLLQRLPSCRIDVFDRAQAPFGLIFYGVAPDHVDMKKSMHSFERMFSDNRDRIALFCNVDVNRDINYEELSTRYEAVVLAYGASKARQLGIAQEKAANCLSGSTFVSWYNGAPLYGNRAPLLDHEDAVIIGNGNVAIDCSRILLSNPERLAGTDITEQALRALKQSQVRRVYVMGRRGPQNCSFTIKELRELLGLPGVHSYCAISTGSIENLKVEMTQMERARKRLLKLILDYAGEERMRKCNESKNDGERQLQLHFHLRPEAIEVDNTGRVSKVRMRNTLNDTTESFPCGLLIYAIGFEHVLLKGVPVAEDGRLAMLDWCRVPSEKTAVYATGWCSHAARGLIADSQQQAYAVADQLADDWENGRIEHKAIGQNAETMESTEQLLQSRGVPYISWEDWRYIDECEQRMGAILGKSREKITDLTSILKIMFGRY